MALQNLLGDIALDDTLQRIVMYLEQIAAVQTRTYPDVSGSMRVAIINGTVTTLANVAAVGGFNTQYDQYCQTMVAADMVRSKIQVS